MGTDPITGQSNDQGNVGVLDGVPDKGTQPSWFDSLPDGLKAEKSLEAFKGKPVTAVVESYVNAEKLVGGSIRLPKADAKPEERAAALGKVYDQLGRPADKSKYVYKLPASEELGLSYDAKRVDSFLDHAHKIGLNSEQVQSLLDYDAQQQVANRPDAQQAFADCMTSLEKGDPEKGIAPWGSTTGQFIAGAHRLVSTMFAPGTMERLDATGLSNDPNFIRGLSRIYRELSEAKVIFPEIEGSATSGSAEDAGKEIDRIMKDSKHAYWDKNHPDHDKEVERMVDLRRYAGMLV